MIDTYEVVMKLIGAVEPVGETHTDNRRYENLKELTLLIEKLLSDIHNIETSYKHSHQFSVKRASTYCTSFLDGAGISND